LNGDIPAALEVYEAYQSCVNVEGGTGPEQAQTALYIIRLCIEQGNYEDAIKRLEKGLESKTINARGEISYMKGESRPVLSCSSLPFHLNTVADLLFKSGRTTEAKDAFLELLKQNPDSHAYYRGLLKTEGLDITTDLSDEQRATVLAKLDELRETYPKSSAPRRLSLEVAQGKSYPTVQFFG
jgi:peptide alpha-N-acetyltransferase